MANGDIKTVSIEANGWNALVTVEGVSTGGTYDFGLGSNYEPINAKLAFSLTSPGYDTGGNVTTIARTVYGVPCQRPTATGAMRKVYPDQASPDETVSGADVVIRVALSEYVYSGDTLVTLTAGAGWYTQGGTPSNATTAKAVTNNSTLGYPRVLGNWATPKYQVVTASSIDIEFCAFHKFAQAGKTVQAVKFTASDGSTTVTSWVTSMSVFPDSPAGKIVGYRTTLDLSTLTDGNVLTINATAYPFVGDSTAILNTGDGVNTNPTPLYAPWVGRMDRANRHGHIVIDPVGGNDTTSTVYSTRAAAEAGNAALTLASALTKMQAYHNTNAGHNDAGGGNFYLKEATYDFNSANGGVATLWETFYPATVAAKANVIVRPGAAAAATPRGMRLKGVTVNGNGTNQFYCSSEASSIIAFDDCAMSSITNTNYLQQNNADGYYLNCTGASGGVAVTIRQFGLVRGNVFTNDTQGYAHCMIGNKNISPSIYPAAASTQKYNDGGICAFNEFGAMRTATAVNFAYDRNVTIGFAFVQNLILRYTTITSPLVSIGMDSNTATSTNIIIHNNTSAGARWNLGYNDTAIATHTHIGWSVKNNIFDNYNNKDDTYSTSANGVGAWPIGYGVGHAGNHFRSTSIGTGNNEWFGEFNGLYRVEGTYATPLAPGFTTDNSLSGANTSGGDYHLTASAPAKALTIEYVMPYDFEGAARTTSHTDAPGVYRYYVAPTSSGGQTWATTGTAWVGGRWLTSNWTR